MGRGKIALAFLGLALLLSGCGGSEDTTSISTSSPHAQKGGEASIEEFGSEAKGGEREEILTAFDGSLEALAEKNYASVCSDLSKSTRSSLEELAAGPSAHSCPDVLPKLLAPSAAGVARQQTEGQVTRVRVEDARAFVVFKAPGAKLYQQTMVEEGGEWKTTTVAASVLVPEL